jgi:hypothetical protein
MFSQTIKLKYKYFYLSSEFGYIRTGGKDKNIIIKNINGNIYNYSFTFY